MTRGRLGRLLLASTGPLSDVKLGLIPGVRRGAESGRHGLLEPRAPSP